MNVFIFGGECQTYLPLQVTLLREFIVDLEEIIWVSGPCSGSRHSSSSREHVDPCIVMPTLRIHESQVPATHKLTRYRNLIEHIAKEYLSDKYGLIIHADLFPVATITKEILLGTKKAATSGGFCPKWTLTSAIVGGRPNHLETAKEWSMSIIDVEGFTMQLFRPAFLHADDISMDDEATQNKKLGAIERWVAAMGS